MPVIKRKLIAGAWRGYCKTHDCGSPDSPDFALLMGLNFKQWQLFCNTIGPVEVSEATARKIKVLAEYPAEHHHTLLKAIDAIYSDDQPEETTP